MLEALYARAPLWLQNAMVSTYGLYWRHRRLGGSFRREVAAFRAREWFTGEEWQAYTTARLRDLLTLAVQRVPHYRGLLSVQEAQSFTPADLPHLPHLPKGTARDDPHSLLIDGRPRPRHRVYHTSGSTGTPIATYWLPEEHRRSLAAREARSHQFAGIGFHLPRATIGGRIVVPDPDSSGPFHRINLAERQIYLSAFHINAANTPVYIKALRDHAIRWMTGYAHAIYDLAAWTLAGGIDAPHLDAVVTTSEPVTPAMRQTIESAFSTRVFEEYAALENAFLVCECEYGRLHINPDAGLIEVVDADFQPVPPGEVGEVLATGFMRPGQPLIRYRVGDRAVLSAEPCPCGRHMPVVETVLGRVEDTVIGPDGRRVMRFHGVFLDQPHIREGQIVQQTVDHILVRVVPAPGFGPNDEAEIRRRVRQRLGERVTVSVQCVEHIARTPAGKFRAVVSTLD